MVGQDAPQFPTARLLHERRNTNAKAQTRQHPYWPVVRKRCDKQASRSSYSGQNRSTAALLDYCFSGTGRCARRPCGIAERLTVGIGQIGRINEIFAGRRTIPCRMRCGLFSLIFRHSRQFPETPRAMLATWMCYRPRPSGLQSARPDSIRLIACGAHVGHDYLAASWRRC